MGTGYWVMPIICETQFERGLCVEENRDKGEILRGCLGRNQVEGGHANLKQLKLSIEQNYNKAMNILQRKLKHLIYEI